jgi:hypothetical protein
VRARYRSSDRRMDPPDRVSGGRDRSESLAALDRNRWPPSVGMLEGSTRSRDTDGAAGEMRDVVEAGLNEAAAHPEVYGRWTRAEGSRCGSAIAALPPPSDRRMSGDRVTSSAHGDRRRGRRDRPCLAAV